MHRGIRKRHARRGFTLIELLVVMAIIGLMIGLLLPAIMYARTSARRMQCQSQLRQIGIALSTYLDAHGSAGKYPVAAEQPTINTQFPSIAKAIGTFIEDSQDVFACPADEDYFPKEGTSYEYNMPRLTKVGAAGQFIGLTRKQALIRRGTEESSTRIMLMWDFDPFHVVFNKERYQDSDDFFSGTTNDPGSRNFLFADGHVDCP